MAARHWVRGAEVTLRYDAPFQLELLSAWGATATAARAGEASFALGEQPDQQYDGFGFTGRGAPPPDGALSCTSLKLMPVHGTMPQSKEPTCAEKS